MHQRTTFIPRACSFAAILACTFSAHAGAEFGANIELDNTYRDGSVAAAADKGISQSGRIEVGASGKAGTDGFIAGRTTFITQKNGSVATDDMWVQIGNKSADIKLGRFEGADLFPLINDTLVVHAGNVYGTNTLRGRMGSDTFHAAGTLQLGSNMSLEIGYIDGTKNAITATNAKGSRVVLGFGSGAFSGRIGVESGEYSPMGTATANKISGVGGTVTYSTSDFKITGNFASGQQNTANNNRQTSYAVSVGMGGLGVGYVLATNDQAGGDLKVQTAYVAYSMPLFGIKGTTLTPAVSTSTLKDSVSGNSTTDNSMRVRIRYDF